MIYFEARTVAMHLINAAAGLGLSVLVAFIALNAATGCGQGGSCVGIGDLAAPSVQAQSAPATLAMLDGAASTTLR